MNLVYFHHLLALAPTRLRLIFALAETAAILNANNSSNVAAKMNFPIEPFAVS